MFYALYGEHRVGFQGAGLLIHHERDGLVVAFDFAVGNASYRIRRTLARKPKLSRTVQAFSLRGEASRAGGQKTASPLAETHRESGLRAWVKQVVGLDSQAFTFAVWLQQGRSDALLKATPKERHQMLAQLIHLAGYERLHERAEAAARHWETQAREAEHSLLHLKPVADTRLEAVIVQEQAAQLATEAAQDQLLRLARWGVQAERWQELERERQKMEQALLACETLLGEGPQIEQEACRAAVLRDILPLVQAMVSSD